MRVAQRRASAVLSVEGLDAHRDILQKLQSKTLNPLDFIFQVFPASKKSQIRNSSIKLHIALQYILGYIVIYILLISAVITFKLLETANHFPLHDVILALLSIYFIKSFQGFSQCMFPSPNLLNKKKGYFNRC